MTEKKTYLGDGVYCGFDGFSFALATDEYAPGEFRNVIVLEPEVYAALVKFVESLKSNDL